MIGVLSLYPSLHATVEAMAARPDAPEMLLPLLQALLLVNPTILLLIGLTVGTPQPGRRDDARIGAHVHRMRR